MYMKIRAWDNSFKQMSHSSQFEVTIASNGIMKATNYDVHGEIQQLEIMRSTELFDANDIEILEGDIISNGYYYWEVVFDKGAFRGVLIKGHNTMLNNQPVYDLIESYPCKIIGHRYMVFPNKLNI